jgi:hypothetical protein
LALFFVLEKLLLFVAVVVLCSITTTGLRSFPIEMNQRWKKLAQNQILAAVLVRQSSNSNLACPNLFFLPQKFYEVLMSTLLQIM